ncbi:MAG: hypothetical protein LBG76_07115 [Treponema sp.]|jgi:hypothetical protein|nr:hypothetical protein [Treponema sp.]
MEVYRPLRAVLFGYDCVRLLLIVGFILPVVPFPGISGGMTFPYLVYAAPNALFPLMSLFVWRRFSTHRSYIMLYTAGKSIVLAAALGWILSSWRELFPMLLVQDSTGLITLIGCGALVLGDAGSVAGGILLKKNPQYPHDDSQHGLREEGGGSSCG